MIDQDIENEFQQYLGSNTKLIWTGRPKTGLIFTAMDTVMVPFSLAWLAFMIYVVVILASSSVKFLIPIYVVPFLAAGFYLSIGRFYLDARNRANSAYGITKDLIIIRSGIFKKNIQFLNIKDYPGVIFYEKTDKSGTIVLQTPAQRTATSVRMGKPELIGRQLRPRLEYIKDVKTVYNLIKELQRQN